MAQKLKIRRLLLKINLIVIALLLVLILSTFFIEYTDTWRYLPVFKYHLLSQDEKLEIFVHAFMFGVNLGFYFQMFVFTFSVLIFFATFRTVSFHLFYSVLILRSILILIQSSISNDEYIAKSGDSSVAVVQIIYISVFILLFILNTIYDHKKRPQLLEPLELKEE